MAEGNGLLNRHRAKSLVAGSNPALSAITWRDRSTRIIRQRAVARQLYHRAIKFHCREKVSLPRHRVGIKRGHNLVRARMAWPVGCGGENGSLERRHAEDEPERGWPPSGSACEAP